MITSIRKYKNYIKTKIYNLTTKELKAILRRKRLRFSKQEILMYLFAIIEFKQKKVYFSKIYKKYKKKFNYKLLYNSFMQNINIICVIFEFLFNKDNEIYLNNYKNKTNLGLNIGIIDSSLLPAIKEESIKWEKHKNRTTKYRGRLVSGFKLFLKINEEKRIVFAQIKDIRKSDITFFKENSNQLIKDDHILLLDSGFMSKALKKILNERKNFKVLAPVRLANKERKGNSFSDFSSVDLSIYKKRYEIERVFKTLKDELGTIKMKTNFRMSDKLNFALIYSSCLEYNLKI